jgi:hypothetical protein
MAKMNLITIFDVFPDLMLEVLKLYENQYLQEIKIIIMNIEIMEIELTKLLL